MLVMICYTDDEMVEFRILIGGSNTKSRITALNFGKGGFIGLLGRILWDIVLEGRGIQENANITAVFKKGAREESGSYRPVSITSIPGKRMEIILLESFSKQVQLEACHIICSEITFLYSEVLGSSQQFPFSTRERPVLKNLMKHKTDSL